MWERLPSSLEGMRLWSSVILDRTVIVSYDERHAELGYAASVSNGGPPKEIVSGLASLEIAKRKAVELAMGAARP